MIAQESRSPIFQDCNPPESLKPPTNKRPVIGY